MAKKKVVKKKTVKKSVAKNNTKKKENKKGILSKKLIRKEELKTKKLLVYSLAIGIISFVIFMASSSITAKGVFGLATILSGSLVLLGIVVELILFLLKRRK
jgi:hypothetical protein